MMAKASFVWMLTVFCIAATAAMKAIIIYTTEALLNELKDRVYKEYREMDCQQGLGKGATDAEIAMNKQQCEKQEALSKIIADIKLLDGQIASVDASSEEKLWDEQQELIKEAAELLNINDAMFDALFEEAPPKPKKKKSQNKKLQKKKAAKEKLVKEKAAIAKDKAAKGKSPKKKLPEPTSSSQMIQAIHSSLIVGLFFVCCLVI